MPSGITPRELSARLAAGQPTYLVDVRQRWERPRPLAGSVPLPLDACSARVAELDLPTGALVVTYCHHGVRSLNAAGWLRSTGVTNVVSLAGGIDAWSREIDPKVPRYG